MVLFRGESSVDEIQQRFDGDVERFSNLETGQSAAIDAPLALDLVTRAALSVTPKPTRVLDLGCGAGNFTMRLLGRCDTVKEVTFVDLSLPMLERAQQRAQQDRSIEVRTLQGDLRTAKFEDCQYDVILAGAVLHHLRSDEEWEQVVSRIFACTSPGGSFWIFDLIAHQHSAIQAMMWERYGEYLIQLKGPEYRDEVFAYATKEDSPRPLPWQLQQLTRAGFDVEVLHARTCFAAFGGIRLAR